MRCSGPCIYDRSVCVVPVDPAGPNGGASTSAAKDVAVAVAVAVGSCSVDVVPFQVRSAAQVPVQAKQHFFFFLQLPAAVAEACCRPGLCIVPGKAQSGASLLLLGRTSSLVVHSARGMA